MSNREIAILIWLGTFLVFALSKKDIRRSLTQFLSILVKPRLLAVFVSIIVFSLIIYYLLVGFKLHVSIAKITFLWVIGNGIPSVLANSSSKTNGKKVSDEILKHLGVGALIGLIMGSYTFSIVVEIAITFLATLFAIVRQVNASKQKDLHVERFSNIILTAIGVLVVGRVMHGFFSSPEVVFSRMAIVDLLFPFILSALFLPIKFSVASYAVIEQQVIRNSFLIRDDEALLRYLNSVTIKRFMFEYDKVGEFNRRLQQLDPRCIDQATIDRIIQELT